MEKNKELHRFLDEVNKAHEERKKEGCMSLNDLFVELLLVREYKHAKS